MGTDGGLGTVLKSVCETTEVSRNSVIDKEFTGIILTTDKAIL